MGGRGTCRLSSHFQILSAIRTNLLEELDGLSFPQKMDSELVKYEEPTIENGTSVIFKYRSFEIITLRLTVTNN